MAHSNFFWSYLDGSGAMGNDFLFLNVNWRIITSQYHGGFCQTWCESTMGAHVFPHPELPSHFPPTPSLWVVPEHFLWVPCFMDQTCTGHLFYIWQYTCFNSILSLLLLPLPSPIWHFNVITDWLSSIPRPPNSRDALCFNLEFFGVSPSIIFTLLLS